MSFVKTCHMSTSFIFLAQFFTPGNSIIILFQVNIMRLITVTGKENHITWC